MVAELCPSCVSAYQDPQTGLCDGCHDEQLRVQYGADDRLRHEKQQAWWRDRQRRHRERKNLRPHEPLAEDADPLEVARMALDTLTRLRPACTSAGLAATADAIAEYIRQLAWGPEA